MRRILFSGDGSGGDLLPMVLMAREFQAAGYEVCVCGSSEFSQIAQDFGVPFEGYPHNYSKIYLENQKTGYIHNMRENIRHQEMLYQGEHALLSKLAPQFDVLINFLAEIYTPSAAEAFGLPNIKLFTFPVVRSELYAPPTGLPFITENAFLNRMQWNLAVVAAYRLFSYQKTVNRLRGELGLPPVADLLGNNSRCSHMMIGLYEELLPPCPSWDFDYTYIGPCIPRTPVPLSDELEDFLQAGERPIYIGFGSMHHPNSDALTETLVGAARDAGVRVILAQNSTSIGEGLDAAEDVYVLKEYPIPHHVLFPRCKAAVHHGSWITTHLAAAGGIPQLILPQASDQFIWADRIHRAGLGPKGVDMNRMKTRKLAAAIADLASRPSYETEARALAERVKEIDGAKNALRLFERIKDRLEPVRS